jgi:Cys-tRNA(Pro)/Cys-tRNA(Cys) deacylase
VPWRCVLIPSCGYGCETNSFSRATNETNAASNEHLAARLKLVVAATPWEPRPRADYNARVTKTNAIRALDTLGIKYELKEYEVDEDDLTAATVAKKVGLPAEQVFKTLCCRGDKKGVCLAVVPGDTELDLKALAKLTGDKKVETVALKELEALTGYIRGGVTALACKKDYPVFLDETAHLFDVISISAGVRGTQIFLAPGDYIMAVQATLGAISK